MFNATTHFQWCISQMLDALSALKFFKLSILARANHTVQSFQEFFCFVLAFKCMRVCYMGQIESHRYKANSQVSQGKNSNLVNKDINERSTHVWRLTIELEKSAVVSLRKRNSDLHRMFNCRFLLLICSQLFEHAARLSLQFTKNKVQKLVG